MILFYCDDGAWVSLVKGTSSHPGCRILEEWRCCI